VGWDSAERAGFPGSLLEAASRFHPASPSHGAGAGSPMAARSAALEVQAESAAPREPASRRAEPNHSTPAGCRRRWEIAENEPFPRILTHSRRVPLAHSRCDRHGQAQDRHAVDPDPTRTSTDHSAGQRGIRTRNGLNRISPADFRGQPARGSALAAARNGNSSVLITRLRRAVAVQNQALVSGMFLSRTKPVGWLF